MSAPSHAPTSSSPAAPACSPTPSRKCQRCARHARSRCPPQCPGCGVGRVSARFESGAAPAHGRDPAAPGSDRIAGAGKRTRVGRDRCQARAVIVTGDDAIEMAALGRAGRNRQRHRRQRARRPLRGGHGIECRRDPAGGTRAPRDDWRAPLVAVPIAHHSDCHDGVAIRAVLADDDEHRRRSSISPHRRAPSPKSRVVASSSPAATTRRYSRLRKASRWSRLRRPRITGPSSPAWPNCSAAAARLSRTTRRQRRRTSKARSSDHGCTRGARGRRCWMRRTRKSGAGETPTGGSGRSSPAVPGQHRTFLLIARFPQPRKSGAKFPHAFETVYDWRASGRSGRIAKAPRYSDDGPASVAIIPVARTRTRRFRRRWR